MKQIKWLALATFITVLIFGCTKNNNDPLLSTPPTSSEVTVQKGVVTFPTIQSYLTVTENKNGEQTMLNTKLEKLNFTALKATPPSTNSNTNTASVMPTISTTAFDANLYSTYLLSVLNSDKILSLSGYYVKVDMDNVFCSAVDAALPNAYNDLKNNTFNNTNVMTFLNPNEPVVDVLDQMRNGQLTWASYQDQLAKKGGQGICFKSGKNSETSDVSKLVGNQLLRATAQYGRYFLHFELVASARYTDNSGNYYQVQHTGNYDWAGVCKGGGVSNYSYTYPFGVPRTAPLIKVVYSGGSALSKIQLISSAEIGNGIKVIAKVGF